MKFLYVADERQAAEQAGLALRAVAPDVAVSWAASLGQARRWIDENRNVTALIIEVETDSRSFEALVTHARGIGVKVPVIGIPLIESLDVLISLRAVADEVVPRDATFLDELPKAVNRCLFPSHAQVQEISVPPYDQRLQQQLREAEAAVARADERAQEAVGRLRAREQSLQAAIEQERAIRVELERRLEDAESARQEVEAAHREAEGRRMREAAALAGDLRRRDQELVDAAAVRQALEDKLTTAASELEQVRERESALTENLSDETRSLAQELAEAKRIVRLADQLHATTKSDAEARVRNIQEQTDARLADAASVTKALQCELADTVARHAESDRAHRTAIEALEATRRDLDTRLAAAAEARRQLEKEHASAMAATRAALLTAEQRASKQQSDAAAAAQSLGTKLAQSVANADRLSAQLSEAQSALTSAGQQATADRQAAAEQIGRQQATFDAALADEVTRREALTSALAERDLAHQNAIQALGATRQELDAQLAAAAEARRQLEEQHAYAMAAARAALESAEQQARADRQAAVEQLAKQQATFDAALADEVTRREALASHLAERDRVHQNAIQALEGVRQDLEARLAAADDTRRQTEGRHASALAAARAALESAEQRASQQQTDAAAAAHARDAKLAESVANADRLRAQLSETQLALTNTEQQAAANQQAAAEQLARQQETFDAALSREVARRRAWTSELAERDLVHQKAVKELEAARQDLENRLAAADEARRQLDEQHATSIEVVRGALEAVERRASKQQEEAAATTHVLKAELAESLADAERLRLELSETAAALAQAKQQAASDRQLAADEANRRQAEFEASIGKEVADRKALQLHLVELQQQADALATQAANDRQTAAQEAAERRAEFETALALEVASRQSVEAQLIEEQGARQKAEVQSAIDLAAVRDELASYRENSESRFAKQQQDADIRFTEQTKLADARLAEALANAAATLEVSLQQAAAQRQAAADRFAGLQAALEASLEQEVAGRQNLAARLTEAEAAQQKAASDHAAALAALKRAHEKAASDGQIAARQAAERRAEFESALALEVANRQTIETRLIEEQGARQKAEAQSAIDLAAARDELASYRESSESRFAKQQQNADTRLSEQMKLADARLAEAMANAAATLEDSLQHEKAEREAAADRFAEQQATLEVNLTLARQSLAASQSQIQQLEAANADGRARLSALQQTFEQAKATAQQSLEALSRDHASERTRLQGIVAERDRQLAEQATSHRVANDAAAKAKGEVEQRLRTTLEAGQRDTQTIKQLEQQRAALTKDVEALNRQRDVLKIEADRVPVLQKHIDETHAEYRRRFDQSPIGMWRSRPDGAIVQANQALVSLLRYKTVAELLKVNFSTAVFESADELQWLVDRCLASRTTEAVETTWRRKDGVGLVVRLMATATSPDGVDFVAIDITMLRALEEKLRNSQRMESVARYASEVAATCTRLLGQVNQEGQHWLTRIESDSARHQGALLLDDVTRAAGFLDQLNLYGKEQKNAPERVEVKQVLRDLEQVLGRVAGSHVELVMPKTSSAYNLDVEMERFERILVNVAAYGRERMPFGGRLVINVSPVVVDRTFVGKYPNVRPGAHVLLTFTEQKGATTPDWSTTVRDAASGGNGSGPSPHKPGVDLGALQALVNECGGHLWILAEPGGNMELRIHLPRRVLDDRVPANKSGRRWINKLTGVRNREAV